MRPLLIPLLMAGIAFAADETRWRDDIDFMVKTLSAKGMTVDFARGPSTRGQKDFEKLYPPAVFQPAITALKDRLPSLSDAGVVLEIMRIIAGARVAHNTVGIPGSAGFERRLPLTFRWYADGLAIVAAPAALRDLAGTRVRTIASWTPEQYLAAVTPFIARENDVWVRDQSAGLLALEPVLAHLGLLGQDGTVSLTLDGAPARTVKVAFTAARDPQESFRKVRSIPDPLYASQSNRFYWHQYLEDTRTMYVQYNRCRQDAKLSMSDFARQVAAEIDARSVERVVVDLRFNGGGDSRVIHPLKAMLAARPRLRVFALIGPRTFSSAIDGAIELKKNGAILVGEPTGGKPSGYGEVKTMTLPHSKLQVRFTSKYFSAPRALDSDALQPDLSVPSTFAAALAGRDPALEAALAVPR